MSFWRMFMTPGARRRADRRDRRHAMRDAENAVADVKDRQKALEAEAKKAWEIARTALKEGEKAAANRALTSCRAAQALALKLEQKRWVFEQYLTKMQVAQSDNQFADALAAMNRVIRIDPERVEDVFGAAQDALGEQVDADRFWNSMYEKEMSGAAGAFQDHIPTMEEMASQLEQEVAAEVGGGAAPAAASGELDARMAEGQKRVKDLLDGK